MESEHKPTAKEIAHTCYQQARWDAIWTATQHGLDNDPSFDLFRLTEANLFLCVKNKMELAKKQWQTETGYSLESPSLWHHPKLYSSTLFALISVTVLWAVLIKLVRKGMGI